MFTQRRGPTWTLRLLLLLFLATMVPGLVFAKDIEDPDDELDSGGPPGNFTPQPVYVKPEDGFDWFAPNRFVQWEEAWHERGGAQKAWPVETYRPGYVNPATWSLYVSGCQNIGDWNRDRDPANSPPTVNQYTWSNGRGTSSPGPDCERQITFPAEGNYTITLKVENTLTGLTQTWSKPVQVKDYLIVVLGDSASSGEGAVDNPIPSHLEADWIDDRCHRSNYSGGAQFARMLEDSSNKTSVTFISLACSGASLNTDVWFDAEFYDPYEDDDALWKGIGMTGPYSGVEPLMENGEPAPHLRLPAQDAEIRRVLSDYQHYTKVAPREMDAMIVSAGINDARFSSLATVCVLFSGCWDEYVGYELDGLVTLEDQFYMDLENIPPGWDLFDGSMFDFVPGGQPPLKAGVKLAFEYPGFFHDENGDYCTSLFWDVLPWWALPFGAIGDLEWGAEEIWVAHQYWAPALNDAVRQGAERNGWVFVDTINDRFFGHGMCASDGQRWINTPTDAERTQGDAHGQRSDLARLSSTGTAHPNHDGYRAIAEELFAALDYMAFNEPPIAVLDQWTLTAGLKVSMDLLANDHDPDTDDVLTARLLSQPGKGTALLSADGILDYKSNGTLGYDTFDYAVSDGEYENATLVRLFIAAPVLAPVGLKPSGSIPIPVGTLLGDNQIEGSEFDVVFPTPPELGTVRYARSEGVVWFVAPEVKKKVTIKLPYEVRRWQDPRIDLPPPWEVVRGTLEITIDPSKK